MIIIKIISLFLAIFMGLTAISAKKDYERYCESHTCVSESVLKKYRIKFTTSYAASIAFFSIFIRLLT